MNGLLVLAAQNNLVALAMAAIIYAATRIWRNPPVAHVLWLLVLLKLLAPPLVHIDGSAWLPAADRENQLAVEDDDQSGVVDRGEVASAVHSATVGGRSGQSIANTTARLRSHGRHVQLALLWLWFGGAAACALLTVTRIVRFERQLRGTLPASAALQRLAAACATRLGIRRVPAVRYSETAAVPLLWCVARTPTVVLPMRLVSQLDDERLALIVAHELAHLRRGDHRVRLVELFVTTIYWWNPVVWLVRRQLHQTEDLCCDAWVRWAFPDSVREYAEVVFEAAELVSAAAVGTRLLPASPFFHSQSLKARIEMLLESRFSPRVSKWSMVALGLFAMVVIPAVVGTHRPQAMAGTTDSAQEVPATPAGPHATSEFPYRVQFEQGATRFADGDAITILEVRGTAQTFEPGNLYWIRGTYKLGSRDRAALSAYTTAMDAANAVGSSMKVQSMAVDKGSGEFSVYYPMLCRGWPHVSFYPRGNGSSFGGNYFGTGDSVLKRWWGEKESE